MKICIFTETYYPVVGGGESQARLLADGLTAAGHSVIILTRRSDPGFKILEHIGPVSIHRLPPAGRGQLKKWGLIFSGLPALIRLRRQYDLIFVSGYRILGIPAVLAGRLLGKRVVLKADSQGEMSGLFFEDGLKKFHLSRASLPFRFFHWLRNNLLRQADAFAAISPEIAAEISASAVPASRIYPVPNSVDTTRFQPASREQKACMRRKLNLPQEGVVAVYTGRLVSYKGLPLLLQVWKQIAQQYPQAILVLAGDGGLDIHNCEAELRQFVHEESLEKQVIFTGAVDNIPEYLQAADIFTFPTQNDAFPSSLIEAMACRLPVITTPIGAIKDIIQDGVNGLMVAPGSQEQVYQALERLIADPGLADRLGQAGFETVQEKYSAQIVVKKYITMFQNLLARAARRPQYS